MWYAKTILIITYLKVIFRGIFNMASDNKRGLVLTINQNRTKNVCYIKNAPKYRRNEWRE